MNSEKNMNNHRHAHRRCRSMLQLMFVSNCYFLLPWLLLPLPSEAKGNSNNSRITVMGIVYCDICSNNTFSKHSYFLPDVEVKIDCKFKADAPKTTEEVSFSVKRSTNRYGVYKLDIPAVDGIECARDSAIVSSCRASLMWTGSSSCNVPGYSSTSDEIAIKSKRANLCIYSLNALNYRPPKRDITLCGH